MCALHDRALFHHDDLIRKPVRNDDHGAAAHRLFQCLLNGRVRLGFECRCALAARLRLVLWRTPRYLPRSSTKCCNQCVDYLRQRIIDLAAHIDWPRRQARCTFVLATI